MVKLAGRSKGGKDKGGNSGGSASAPSSPTRRLKKGGKRGRRLCHREGCTLCPSFGFEGDVAVSCSHHKEEGMRNLTARRCQHEGCFTVANFGMPGDKPGFCAAHSTQGMVNRNKPRGGEGMLMTVARSSRRASKPSSAALEAAGASKAMDAAAAAAAAAAVSRVRPPSGGGKGLLMPAAGASSVPDGGFAGEKVYSLNRTLGRRVRATESPQASFTPHPSIDEGSTNAPGAHGTADRSKERVPGSSATLSLKSSATFVSRRQGPHSIPAVQPTKISATKGVGAGVVGGAGRHKPRGAKSVGGAPVTASDLHRPEVVHEAFVCDPRVDANFQRRYADHGMLAGGSNHGCRVGGASVDLGFPGNIRVGGGGGGGGGVAMHSSFQTDISINSSNNSSNGTDTGAVGAPVGLEMGGSLHEILGVESDALEEKTKEANSFAAAPCSNGGMTHSMNSVRSSHGGMGAAGSMGGLTGVSGAGASPGSGGSVIGGGPGLSGGGAVDHFELDHMPELNSIDLAGLPAAPAFQGPAAPVESGAEMRRSARQGTPRTPIASSVPISMPVNSLGLQIGGGSTLATCSVNDVSTAPSPSAATTSPVAAAAAAAVAAVRSSPPGPSANALVPPKLPADDAWWEALGVEDFVAMPEPIWEAPMDSPSLPGDTSQGHHDSGAWRGMKAAATAPSTNGGNYALEGTSVSEQQPFPAQFSSGTTTRTVKPREFISNGMYSPPPSALVPGAPAGFGLTVMSNCSPLSPASQLQANGPSPMQMTSGGSGVRPAVGLSSGNLNKVWPGGEVGSWGSRDAVSPSKRLSLSPTKFMSASPSTSTRPLLAQSTPPWGAGPLCPHQQTQAAGRA